jgi:hypothetical protein
LKAGGVEPFLPFFCPQLVAAGLETMTVRRVPEEDVSARL